MNKAVTEQSENAVVYRESFPAEILHLEEGHMDYFAELVQVFQQAFHSNEKVITEHHYLRQLLTDQNFIVMAAIQSGKVVGGLTAYVLNGYHSTRPSVYLYDLAVLLSWRRRGVGKRLISVLLQLCKEKDIKEVFVQAEANDADAIAFYRNTPISDEINATQFNYTLLND